MSSWGSQIAELLALAPEGGLVDAQDLGCFLKGFGRGQYAADVVFLDHAQGHPVAQLDGGAMRRDGLGKIFDADDVPGAENGRALDGIAQLPDVARPRVVPQRQQRIVGKPSEGLVILSTEKPQHGRGQKLACRPGGREAGGSRFESR